MKICLLTHSSDSSTGAGRFASRLANGIESGIPGTQISILTANNLLSPKLGSLFFNLRSIRKEFRMADVIHALDAYPYGVMAHLANIFINKPLIITAVGAGSVKFLQSKSWRYFLLRRAYISATKLTAISGYVAKEIKKYIPNLEIAVINHGVDSDFWSKEEGLLDDGISKAKPYILTVGEMKERKGYVKALEVMSEVLKSCPKVKYVIVSNVERNIIYWRKIEEQIRNLKLTNKVIVVSKISDENLRIIYQNAIAYLLLPQNVGGDVEGFGLALLEAAASGLPVVVGKGSGADDALINNISGYLVNQNSPHETVQRLVNLIKDDKLREKLSTGARTFAIKMSWPKQVSKYLKIYEEF